MERRCESCHGYACHLNIHAHTFVQSVGVAADERRAAMKQVINPDANDKLTRAIKQLNAKIFSDERVDICMLPTADGITIAHKR
eukprot:COSAG02_NODE_4232_length_5607_cov_1.383805_4_plen_84_part_00